MEREVVRMNEKTLIRIPKNLVKSLGIDKRYSYHLYFSPNTNVPFLRLLPFTEPDIRDIEEFSKYLGSIENSVWFYHNSKTKWWIETTAETYDEYYEIFRDYPNSAERYTTLVKRYCKWA